MANKVTSGQVYRNLKEFYEKNGYSPSVRELAGILGTSSGSVHRHMKTLKSIGWISAEPNKARSLKLHK
ncbi:transcriptional repressor, LexA family [Desulfofarcimen acetoxidans DSM 771]|uniref:Transcriptional repressor, LexA family n=1 Tax=Desulfofarcimen acetoxidans (strain ATCC 49208 / DSM 771 / KCTC 5769 / VKM B-1644 / 5575) TaxID=485916 RepID=C8VY67_DESAS|nr:winged helix-turn-helix transcriptional regulator [Desulfofarcimen acetoxidans]ACV64696.1 transcriptional repressor, LexA family [Desulfofarcimen acetoxidans DSM 771]